MDGETNALEESRALLWQVMARTEEERDALSYTLHERMCQDLVFAMHLLQVDSDVEGINPRKLAGARDVLQHLLNDIRNLSYELRPSVLADPDLTSMLEWRARIIERDRGLRVSVETQVSDGAEQLPTDVRIALFRIFEESVDNAIRHGQAQEARVTLEIERARVWLEIQDDGIGFTVPESLVDWVRQGKLGLVTMREKAAAIGGVFFLESRVGEGARIAVDVHLGGTTGPIQET